MMSVCWYLFSAESKIGAGQNRNWEKLEQMRWDEELRRLIENARQEYARF